MKESTHERMGYPIVEGSRLSCHEAHLRDGGGAETMRRSNAGCQDCQRARQYHCESRSDIAPTVAQYQVKLEDWRDALAQGPTDRTRVRVMHVAMAMVLAWRVHTAL